MTQSVLKYRTLCWSCSKDSYSWVSHDRWRKRPQRCWRVRCQVDCPRDWRKPLLGCWRWRCWLDVCHQSEEVRGVVDCFGGGFEKIASALAPETVWRWLCVRGFSGWVWGPVWRLPFQATTRLPRTTLSEKWTCILQAKFAIVWICSVRQWL